MKQAAISLLALILISCVDDNKMGGILVDNTFTAKRNNLDWTGVTEIHYDEVTDTLTFLGIANRPNDEVIIMKIKFEGTGSYPLTNNQGYYYRTVGGDVLISEYRLTSDSPGQFVISKYDQSENAIEGFFKMTLKKEFSNPENNVDYMNFSEGKYKGKIDILFIVDFDFHIEGYCSTPDIEVILENKSSTADSYLWDFGDGTSSDLTNPKKIYTKSGIYTINLQAFLSGRSTAVEKEIVIGRNSGGTGPTAQLTFTRPSQTSFQINFEINSSGLTYLLDFGDGLLTSSNEMQIVHTYAAPGRYSAFLTVQNGDGSNCAEAKIDLTP